MMNKPTEIEKAFASAFFANSDIPQVFYPNDPKSWSRIRKIIRETAYHEAGHYVARCFTGLETSHVMLVSIIPDKINNGRVRCERPITELSLESYPPSLQRCNGMMLLLDLLAGAGAALRIDDEEGAVESIFDYWEEEYFEYREQKGTDQFRAFRIATIMKKPYVSADRILNLADKWTMEMLAIPFVWNAVETVASKLLDQGEINREELEDMDSSWSKEGLKVPFYLALPKWRRRLFPK